MKKLFALLTLAGFLTFGVSNMVIAQETATTDTAAQTEAAAPVEEAAPVAEAAPAEEVVVERTMHQVIKDKFIAGGAEYMAPILICMVLGLAIVIERIIYLSLSTTNTTKFVAQVDEALKAGGVDKAKELCRNTRGPVASIFYQGLDRAGQGLDAVEKSVVSYGSVEMGRLEKGLSWISLFIAMAPMLGFFGTVIGMIQAFDAIAAANNISPGIVASGIGVALITTVGGLIVAMILQVFYNYLIAKIESVVGEMEDASISLIDVLIKNNSIK